MNFKRSREDLLEYFKMERLLDAAFKAALNPHIETGDNAGGGNGAFDKNKEETKCIAIADNPLIKNLKRTEKIIGEVLQKLNLKEKYVIETLYKTDEGERLSYLQVCKITQIKKNEIIEIDNKVNLMICKIRGY